MQLTKVTLSRCSLTAIPDPILDMQSLIELNISGNNIEDITGICNSLPELQVLDCSDNPIPTFPVEMGNMGQLKQLLSYKCKLHHLPRCTPKANYITTWAVHRIPCCIPYSFSEVTISNRPSEVYTGSSGWAGFVLVVGEIDKVGEDMSVCARPTTTSSLVLGLARHGNS